MAAACRMKGREFPDAKHLSDYREMLDQVGDKVDIVTVSTPDHNDAAAAVKAMRMKKPWTVRSC